MSCCKIVCHVFFRFLRSGSYMSATNWDKTIIYVSLQRHSSIAVPPDTLWFDTMYVIDMTTWPAGINN
eukprot:scaffold197_cov16-Prasinocladus_malaysianus.AAC.1